jgi:hypothetical protein
MPAAVRRLPRPAFTGRIRRWNSTSWRRTWEHPVAPGESTVGSAPAARSSQPLAGPRIVLEPHLPISLCGCVPDVRPIAPRLGRECVRTPAGWKGRSFSGRSARPGGVTPERARPTFGVAVEPAVAVQAMALPSTLLATAAKTSAEPSTGRSPTRRCWSRARLLNGHSGRTHLSARLREDANVTEVAPCPRCGEQLVEVQLHAVGEAAPVVSPVGPE